MARAFPAVERRAARQICWLGATRAVQALGGLAAVYLCARILGVAGFGALAVIIAVAGLLHELAAGEEDTGLTYATRSTVRGEGEAAAGIFRFALVISLGLGFVAYAVIAALAFIATGVLNIDQGYQHAMLVYGVTGILTATNGQTRAMLRLADRVQLHLLVTVASIVVRVGLLAVVWRAGGGIMGVALAYVAGAGVNGFGTFVAAAATAPRAGLSGFLRSASLKVPPEVTRFHAGTYLRAGIRAAIDNMDVILLAQFAGPADVGAYRAARRIAVTAVGGPLEGLIANAVRPEYSRQWYSGDGRALRRTVFRATVLSVGLAAAGFVGLAVFGEAAIRLLLGAEFAGAAALLPIMALGALRPATLRMLPGAAGRIGPSLLANTAGLAVFLAAIVWLAPEYGAVGAAWARTASFLFAFLVIIPFVISILRQSYQPGGQEG